MLSEPEREVCDDGLQVRWAAPSRVGAAMSLREGGVSLPPFDRFNLGDHVGDDPAAVAANRAAFEARLAARAAWLRQVHGASVVDAARHLGGPPPQADGSWTATPGVACAVLVADCLPVLLADRHGRAVGAAHAGWRGLAAGVLEATVDAVARAAGGRPADVVAWLGPCIGRAHFEVGPDVLAAFGGSGVHFTPAPRPDGLMRWRADLPGLATQRLRRLGVVDIAGGAWCTVGEPSRFYSFRRDGVTGRAAAAVWLRD